MLCLHDVPLGLLSKSKRQARRLRANTGQCRHPMQTINIDHGEGVLPHSSPTLPREKRGPRALQRLPCRLPARVLAAEAASVDASPATPPEL